MAFLYVGAFIVPGPTALATIYGISVLRQKDAQKILGPWLLALLCYYLLWFGSGLKMVARAGQPVHVTLANGQDYFHI